MKRVCGAGEDGGINKIIKEGKNNIEMFLDDKEPEGNVEKMRIAFDIKELIDAFEKSDALHHFFVDTSTGRLVSILDSSEQINPQKPVQFDIPRYLKIPSRSPDDVLAIMELFIYDKVHGGATAKRFHQIFGQTEQLRGFMNLLAKSPTLQKQWVFFQRKHLKNEAINWLCSHDFELECPRLIPKISIRELTADERKGLPRELKDFRPVACLDCHNTTRLSARLFTCNVGPENMLIENETRRILKERFGVSHHGGWSGGKQDFLTAGKCPQCGSENLFWDY